MSVCLVCHLSRSLPLPAAFAFASVFAAALRRSLCHGAITKIGVLKHQLASVLEGARQLEAGVKACEGRVPYRKEGDYSTSTAVLSGSAGEAGDRLDGTYKRSYKLTPIKQESPHRILPPPEVNPRKRTPGTVSKRRNVRGIHESPRPATDWWVKASQKHFF